MVVAKVTVYIHIGAHKTGTTSLQKSLSEHRNILRQFSIEYPECPISPRRYAHHQLINWIAKHEKVREKAGYAELIDAVRQKSANGNKVLLSAESAYRHLCESGGEEFLGRLEKAFLGVCVVPVVVFRRQDEFARSLYAEWVRNWGEIATFPEFLRQKKNWFAYVRNVRRLRKVFPLTRIISFDLLQGASLTQRFLLAVFARRINFPRSHERKSASDAIVMGVRELNCCGKKKLVRRFIEWAEGPGSASLPDHGVDFLFASFEARRSFYEQFRVENQRLASLCSSSDEFFKEPEWDEMQFDVFLDEGVNSLLRKFFAEQQVGD